MYECYFWVLIISHKFLAKSVNIKGTGHDFFPGQENPFIIFRSKEKYIHYKTNNKIPINMLKYFKENRGLKSHS